MEYLKFRIQVLVRILLIVAFGYSGFYVLFNTPFSLSAFWLALFAILVLTDLLRYVEKSNREMSNFLLGIQQNDFSNIYPEGRTKNELHKAFNVITKEFIKKKSYSTHF